jgi:hypothetical protein
MVSRARLGAVTSAVALLLAGCAGSVDSRELTETSPLAEFLGTPPRSQLGLPHLDERERQLQDQHAELVAQCMAAAGFEYQAVSMQERLGQTFLDAYALRPAEFTERYGYGVTTLEVAEFVDPNEQLRAALEPGRQQEYDRALWGGSAADGSCQQRATTEVYGDPASRQAGFAEFDDLLAAIDDVYRRIDGDPRLREAHRRWAECLTGAGYPGMQAPADARRSVFDRLPAAPPTGPAPPGNAADPSRQIPAEQLAEIREYELALAAADRACQRWHVDSARRLVTMELEGAFVDTRRQELTRYRDWLAG